MNKTERFFNSLKSSRVALIGTGVSHTELIKLFLSKGIDVTILDRKTKEQFDPELYSSLEGKGAHFVLGDGYLDSLTDYDVVYRTPGMYYNNPKLAEARAAGVIITSEMESFFELCPCKIYAVTGSDGKTTTTTVIKKLLTAFGHKCGLIGTCGNEIGDEPVHAERTTPEPDEFFELLSRMADAGCEYVIMEVSSQGLCQYRLGDAYFDVAGFTNLTQDHLDVHGTMENYYQAKKLLFERCRKALVNMDDAYGKRLFGEITCEKYSFSIDDYSADYSASGTELESSGSDFWYSTPKKSFKAHIRLPGSYNVSNCLAALAALDLMGYEGNASVPAIANVAGVRGRCEVVPTGRDFTVILDYAHTPDALDNILSAVRVLTKGRLVCLFGCGGNRDPIKRPLMAKSAAHHADFLIVTSDNPRDEEPHAIITEIIAGLEGEACEYIEIVDRREAIFWAIENARPGDVIVLAGKGHEDYQILAGGQKIHFDEREVVAEALESLK